MLIVRHLTTFLNSMLIILIKHSRYLTTSVHLEFTEACTESICIPNNISQSHSTTRMSPQKLDHALPAIALGFNMRVVIITLRLVSNFTSMEKST